MTSHNKMAVHLSAWLLSLLPLLPAHALDTTWSGFGTLGFAVSDQPYAYQRSIDDQGTFSRDSLLGGQLDARLGQQWSLTAQAKLAPSASSDSAWRATLPWAFVSWRPTDDWLVRAGKIRLPLMLNAENYDVGATFEFARLPQEVYAIAPTNDVLGLSITKSWVFDVREIALEAYSGIANTHQRYFGRDVTPNSLAGQRQPGSFYVPFKMHSTGLVLTVRDISNVFRIGVHEVSAKRRDRNSRESIPLVQGPGFTFYDVNAGPEVDELKIPVQTLGASYLLPAEIRLTAEYARMRAKSASDGLTRWGGYLGLSRRFGDWVPYAYYARMKSTGSALAKYRAIEASALTAPTAFLNDYQHLASDVLLPFDQWTAALGTSYRLASHGLLKLEWSQTHTGVASGFIDAPPNQSSGQRRINVYSLSYSFSF